MGEGGRSSRPRDKQRGRSQIFFWPFGPQLGVKIRGGGGGGGADPSGSTTVAVPCQIAALSEFVASRVAEVDI